MYSIFKGLLAKFHGAELDAEGIAKEALPHDGAKVIHVTPSCQYPTTTQMSLTRRRDLLQYANEQKSVIIENDYEHEVHNYSDSLPSLFSLDTQQRVV